MDTATVLALVKARLGISTSIRDEYLAAITQGVIQEMPDVYGVTLDADNHVHLMFVTDLVTWRYQSRDSDNAMPRHLQFRMHNLIMEGVRADGESESV